MRVLSVGSLPPAWGGSAFGGVATLHATLLEGFASPGCGVELVGVVTTTQDEREPPVAENVTPFPVFVRPAGESTATFYERLLDEVEPDAVIMHHFAHSIGVAHAQLRDAPPAIGIAHSWHNITFGAVEQRGRARETTARALGGLRALVVMSRHCLREGERLGLTYPPVVKTIHHPLQPRYAASSDGEASARERAGVVCLGSLIPRKNPTVLVEAAARIPGLEVTFAGHGDLEDPLLAMIASRSLADRVGIRHLDDAQVRDLLLRSEAMCLPSHSETFGLGYIEALACGTPVVGFGPTLHEIRHEVGVGIGEPLEKGTVNEVVAAIERVRATRWDRAELRGRTIAAFDLSQAVESYVELLRRVVGRYAVRAVR